MSVSAALRRVITPPMRSLVKFVKMGWRRTMRGRLASLAVQGKLVSMDYVMIAIQDLRPVRIDRSATCVQKADTRRPENHAWYVTSHR